MRRLLSAVRRGRRPPPPWRRALPAAAALVALLAAATLAANAVVVIGERHVDEVADAPRAPVAIVLGAPVGADGRMSRSLADRVAVGAWLWRAGKAGRVLASGANTQRPVSEPDAMRDALLRAGIPPSRIFLDYEGVNTRATMERARHVYGVTEALVVTQRFHIDRALYLAQAAGIKATGVTADLSDRELDTRVHDQLREVLARVKAMSDVVLRVDSQLDPRVSAQDGRETWRTRPFVTPPQPLPRR